MEILICVILIVIIIFMIKYEKKEHFKNDQIVQNFKYFDKMLVNATNSIRRFNRDMFKRFYNYKKNK